MANDKDAEKTNPTRSTEHAIEEYEENIATLKKLFQGKTRPAQIVQDLLDATRQMRMEWIQESADISVCDILEKFPALGHPKWVKNLFTILT